MKQKNKESVKIHYFNKQISSVISGDNVLDSLSNMNLTNFMNSLPIA